MKPSDRPAKNLERDAWRNPVEHRHRLVDLRNGAYAFQEVMASPDVLKLLEHKSQWYNGCPDNKALEHASTKIEWLAGRLGDPVLLSLTLEIGSGLENGRPPLSQLNLYAQDIIRLCSDKLGLPESDPTNSEDVGKPDSDYAAYLLEECLERTQTEIAKMAGYASAGAMTGNKRLKAIIKNRKKEKARRPKTGIKTNDGRVVVIDHDA